MSNELTTFEFEVRDAEGLWGSIKAAGATEADARYTAMEHLRGDVEDGVSDLDLATLELITL